MTLEVGLLPGMVVGSLGPIGFRWQLLRCLPALLFMAVAVLVVIYSSSNWILGRRAPPKLSAYLSGTLATWLMRFGSIVQCSEWEEGGIDMDIIRLGDSTDHGGKVIQAFSQTNLNGKPIAGVGHAVVCPKCKGIFPIAEGSALLDVAGIPVALDGMKTACGASLIASAPHGAVDG